MRREGWYSVVTRKNRLMRHGLNSRTSSYWMRIYNMASQIRSHGKMVKSVCLALRWSVNGSLAENYLVLPKFYGHCFTGKWMFSIFPHPFNVRARIQRKNRLFCTEIRTSCREKREIWWQVVWEKRRKEVRVKERRGQERTFWKRRAFRTEKSCRRVQ